MNTIMFRLWHCMSESSFLNYSSTTVLLIRASFLARHVALTLGMLLTFLKHLGPAEILVIRGVTLTAYV